MILITVYSDVRQDPQKSRDVFFKFENTYYKTPFTFKYMKRDFFNPTFRKEFSEYLFYILNNRKALEAGSASSEGLVYVGTSFKIKRKDNSVGRVTP